ncbi:hypothetical protein FOCC_FOCC015474 [Frankliniella occidentalis]|nr:hypothetical protein FOCC_FOCC015474 [Frankliniella occidentalis]
MRGPAGPQRGARLPWAPRTVWATRAASTQRNDLALALVLRDPAVAAAGPASHSHSRTMTMLLPRIGSVHHFIYFNWQKISFWFATGGAGFCLSRALALKMLPVAGGGKFISIGEKIRLPDDVTMGYVIGIVFSVVTKHLLRKPLTVIDQFHSHFEPMKFIRQETMHEQITFSYSRYSKHEVNVLKIDGFDSRLDPTRFLSLHCLLFSYLSFCPR